MLVWFIAIALLVLAIFSFTNEPRKLRIGILLLASLSAFSLAAIETIITSFNDPYNERAAWFLLGLVAISFVSIFALALFLMYNGFVTIRRETNRLPNLLSLILGAGLMAYVGLGVIVVFANSGSLAIWIILSAPVVGYLGFVFAAFVLYAWLYSRWVSTFGGPVNAVIVLGAGLAGNKVTPLLASRLTKGRHVFDNSRRQGLDTKLVVSGGQGADELVPEAEAMSSWLMHHGVSGENMLLEPESRNTYENLVNSKHILATNGVAGPTAVVTSNFHAFRAATLMRKVHMTGYSVGAPTARYYWPTATIREFLALLRDNARVNAIILAGLSLPFVGYTLGMLVGLVR